MGGRWPGLDRGLVGRARKEGRPSVRMRRPAFRASQLSSPASFPPRPGSPNPRRLGGEEAGLADQSVERSELTP